jgi:hypothetical protein
MEICVEALGQPPVDVGAVVSSSGARCRLVRGVSEVRSKTNALFGRGGQSAEPELRREFLEELRNRSPWGLERQGGEVCVSIGT